LSAVADTVFKSAGGSIVANFLFSKAVPSPEEIPISGVCVSF
jgi:hypothetical protein